MVVMTSELAALMLRLTKECSRDSDRDRETATETKTKSKIEEA
jgi:hypothetical protein